MSVNPHNCDDMLHESMGVKLLKKKFKKLYENLSKFTSENDDLIAKLNKSNKLVERYKKLAENSFEKMKEFKCLNMDLDAKLVLFNKFVDDLKCENKSQNLLGFLKVGFSKFGVFYINSMFKPILCFLSVIGLFSMH